MFVKENHSMAPTPKCLKAETAGLRPGELLSPAPPGRATVSLGLFRKKGPIPIQGAGQHAQPTCAVYTLRMRVRAQLILTPSRNHAVC